MCLLERGIMNPNLINIMEALLEEFQGIGVEGFTCE
jgi:hypothetical protein